MAYLMKPIGDKGGRDCDIKNSFDCFDITLSWTFWIPSIKKIDEGVMVFIDAMPLSYHLFLACLGMRNAHPWFVGFDWFLADFCSVCQCFCSALSFFIQNWFQDVSDFNPFYFTEGSPATENTTFYIDVNSDYIGIIFWGRKHELLKKFTVQMTICWGWLGFYLQISNHGWKIIFLECPLPVP